MMTEVELQSFLDRKLCEIADALLLYYNPCDIKGSACRAADPNPCCVDTRYGSPCPFQCKGCHFQNIDCKTWLCDTAIAATDPKCVQALKVLEQFGLLFELIHEPLIGHPYSGVDRPK